MGLVNVLKKRQHLPISAGLWIVATPIGNLGGISDRARLALTHASRILCEDTRRTGQLLEALGLSRVDGERFTLERADAYASPAQLEKLIESLEAGENLALVTTLGRLPSAIPEPILCVWRMSGGFV